MGVDEEYNQTYFAFIAKTDSTPLVFPPIFGGKIFPHPSFCSAPLCCFPRSVGATLPSTDPQSDKETSLSFV